MEKLSKYILLTLLLVYSSDFFVYSQPKSGGKSDQPVQGVGNMKVVGDSSTVVIQLKEAGVSATVEPMKVVSDTVEYSSAAYVLPEDAMLEDLLLKIPGLEINGNVVTLNGREVKQLLIDGQRFFGGNVKAGLKNISADMIAKVRAYDRESDFSRITGIDDGEREPVIDLKVKKSMMDGWIGNISGGYGMHGRYSGRLSANKITKKAQNTVIANVNNLNPKISINNASRSQLGGGSGAENNKREAGFNISRKNSKKEFDLSFHYDGNNKNSNSHTESQSVTDKGLTSYSGYTDSKSWNNTPSFNARFEWRPKKNFTIFFKPNAKITMSSNDSHSYGDNFNLSGKKSNSTNNYNYNIRDNIKGGFVFQVTRRSDVKRGRSFTVSTNNNFEANTKWNPLKYATRYYLIKKNPDSLKIREVNVAEYYGVASLNGQLTYNEPLGKGFHFTTNIGVNSTLKHSVYNLSDALNGNRRMDGMCYDAHYNFIWFYSDLNIRYIKKKFNITAGVRLRPLNTKLSFTDTLGRDTVVRKSEFIVSPNFTLRIFPSSTSKISVTYNNYVSQASSYDAVPVKSGTNPLYVHYGNENLRPTIVHRIEGIFNISNLRARTSFLLNTTARFFQNRVSSMTTYDPESGGTVSRATNVNGYWEIKAYDSFTKTFGLSPFSIAQRASLDYVNNVSYFYNSSKRTTDLNTSRRLMAKASFEGIFRIDYLELIANVNGDYTNETNLLRPEMNQQPYSFGAGFKATATLPWKMRLMADFSFLGQRGYVFNELNREYYVLNAGIYQSFFKGRLVFSLEGFDLLGQLPNLTRSFGTSSRNIITYNGYNSYIIGKLVYKFNFKSNR